MAAAADAGAPGGEPDVLAVLAYRFAEAFGYGSRARGQAQAASDLDLAVIVRQPQLTLTEKARLLALLEAELGRCEQAVERLG